MTGSHDTKAAEDRHIGFRWLSREAGLATEQDAEGVFRAVARLLAERIGKDESRHVASHLPLGLREVWEAETAGIEKPERFDRADFIARIKSRLGLERSEEAEELVQVVFAWLRYLAPEERDDVSARLPADLKDLWERALLLHLPHERLLSVKHD